MRRLIVGLVLVLLGGCAVAPPLPPPPATGFVPDLVGTWRGTWAGEPVSLLIISQTPDIGDYSGVFIAGYQVLGPRRPGISGVLTSTIRGEAVSSRAEGWIGNDATGRLLLLVQSESPAGFQYLTLARVTPSQFAGSGESSFSWGPRGPAELTRRSP
jgi:hypothetical protein